MRIATCILALAALSASAGASVYSGSLQYTPPTNGSSDGLRVLGPSGQWDSYTVTMEWTVTDEDTSQPGYPWKYTYHFSHSGTQYGFSHIIIETSSGFTAADMVGLDGAGVETIGMQTVMSGNPDMSEDMYGIRFSPGDDGITDLTWTFYSDRAGVGRLLRPLRRPRRRDQHGHQLQRRRVGRSWASLIPTTTTPR